jgi:hypothetical protein
LALSGPKLSDYSGAGSAAATARPASGGRGVASEKQAVEMSTFTGQIGVGDQALAYDEQPDVNADARRRSGHQGSSNAFLSRLANSFQATSEESAPGYVAPVHLHDVLRGVTQYEFTQRVAQGMVRPGSSVNQFF